MATSVTSSQNDGVFSFDDDDDDDVIIEDDDTKGQRPSVTQSAASSVPKSSCSIATVAAATSATTSRWTVDSDSEEVTSVEDDKDEVFQGLGRHQEAISTTTTETKDKTDGQKEEEDDTPLTQEQQLSEDKENEASEDVVRQDQGALSQLIAGSTGRKIPREVSASEACDLTSSKTRNDETIHKTETQLSTFTISSKQVTSPHGSTTQVGKLAYSSEQLLSSTPVQRKQCQTGIAAEGARPSESMSVLYGNDDPSAADTPFQQLALWKQLGLKIPTPKMGELVCKDKRSRRTRFILCDGQNVIGRADSCSVQLESVSPVSSRHASVDINWTEGIFTIRDLSSTNGTMIRRPVTDSTGATSWESLFLLPRRLYNIGDGTEVTFGDFTCTVNMLSKAERKKNFEKSVKDFGEAQARKTAERGISTTASAEHETQIEGASMTVPYPTSLNDNIAEGPGGQDAESCVGNIEESIQHTEGCKGKTSTQKDSPPRRNERQNRATVDSSETAGGPSKNYDSVKSNRTTRRAKRVNSPDRTSECAEPLAKKTKTSASTSARSSKMKSVKKQEPVKILFTRIVPTQAEKKDITKMGGEIVDDPHQATHLITTELQRTVKLLTAISKVPHIVTRRWLQDSRKAGSFIELAPDCAISSEQIDSTNMDKYLKQMTRKYRLSDNANEKQFDVSLQEVLPRRNLHSPILKGYTVYATKSVKPPPDLLKDIVEAAGGKWTKTVPKKSSSNLIIICAEVDLRKESKLKRLGCPLYREELILSGILRQDLPWDSAILYQP